MERISNRIEELQKAAVVEIEQLALKPTEKIIAYFSEYPSISGFPFKITLVRNADGLIYSSFRQWDTAYDFKRWSNGIYNLDRLRIRSEIKYLSSADSTTLKIWLMDLQRFELPKSIAAKNALVLDGSDWKFGIHHGIQDVHYTWKSPSDQIKIFMPFIELMLKQHTSINKRNV